MTSVTPRGHYLGRKKDSADPRDHFYGVVHAAEVAPAPPPSADISAQLPPCFDQGQEGSCGPNSGAGMMAHQFPELKQLFSRNQIYWDVRSMEGDTTVDGGVETRDVLKALTTTGAALEKSWPYSQQTLFKQPPTSVIVEASQHKLLSYSRLLTDVEYMSCVASDFSFILGFTCFSSIDSPDLARTGVMPMPDTTREQQVGGHDVLVVGYDTNFKNSDVFKKSGVDPSLVSDTALKIRNSWGVDWGLEGHFWMPMPYAVNPSIGGDAWTGRRYAPPVSLVRAPASAVQLVLTKTQLAAGDAAARAIINKQLGWQASFVSDDTINQVVSQVGTIIINTK